MISNRNNIHFTDGRLLALGSVLILSTLRQRIVSGPLGTQTPAEPREQEQRRRNEAKRSASRQDRPKTLMPLLEIASRLGIPPLAVGGVFEPAAPRDPLRP